MSVTGSIKEPFLAFFKEPLTYDISIDRDSQLSLVRQLSDGLRARILDGRLTAGSKVPSTRDAAASLSVARNVVLEAYEQLEAEGYLEGIAGSGTRVADITGSARLPARLARGQEARPMTVIAARTQTGSPTRAPAIDVDFATACGVPEPSVFPVAAWKRCVAASAADVALDGLAFPDARGHEGLREELSSLVYRSRGIACGPERIFVTRGTTHALSLVARYLRPRSSLAVIEDPMLNSFRRLLARFSFGVECVPVDEAGLRVDALRGAVSRSRAGIDREGRNGFGARGCLTVVTPSHQFPSGVILPVSRRLELLDFAASSNGWVFEDDYDGELRLRGVPVPPILCLDPSRVFYAGTFNKTLYPALRLGYLIAPDREVEPFAAMIRAHAEWPETLASGALASFIGEGAYERHLRTLRKLYSRRRAALEESVARRFGDVYAVKGSEAGCHCRLSPTQEGSSRIVDAARALSSGVAVAEVAHYLDAKRAVRARARGDGTAAFLGDLLLGYGNLDEATIDRGIATLSDAIG